MVTAFSTFAEELLCPSPDLLALLLRLRLLQLEALRNNMNLDGEWTGIFSTRSTTNLAEGKMERNHSKPWDPRHTRTWVKDPRILPLLRPTYGPGGHSVSTQAAERASMASGAAIHQQEP